MNGDVRPELRSAESPRVTPAKVAGGGWLLLCLAVLWSRSNEQNLWTSPFVGRDVAFICLLSVLPFGLMIARLARNLTAETAYRIMGGLCWILSATSLALLLQQNTVVSFGTTGVWGYIVRPCYALLFILPCAWLWVSSPAARLQSDSRWLAWVLTTGIIALALPSTYVIARCRQDVIRLRELTAQSRLGEASLVAQRLRRLAPGVQVQGIPIARLVADIDRSVRHLQSAVAVTPAATASDDDWLLRAQQLAILGQTDAALSALTKVRTPRPAAHNLSGTIRETRAEWPQAFADYAAAQREWVTYPISPEQQAGRIQATKGMAYCLRKQGRYGEAEQAYQQLLTQSPTADVHFLLAQFYEDTQQTSLARQHVRQAILLAPDQFQQSGQRLINKLATAHFGCFNIMNNQPDE